LPILPDTIGLAHQCAEAIAPTPGMGGGLPRPGPLHDQLLRELCKRREEPKHQLTTRGSVSNGAITNDRGPRSRKRVATKPSSRPDAERVNLTLYPDADLARRFPVHATMTGVD
jgi:hypothetical protein